MGRPHVRLVILTLISLALISFGCSHDPSGIPILPPPDLDDVQEITTLQRSYFEYYKSLLEDLSPEEACGTTALFVAQHPAVDWARSSRHGIAIQYEDGQRGGILLDPDDGMPYVTQRIASDLVHSFVAQSLGSTPGERAVFLVPHYEERQTFADEFLASVQDPLVAAGYDPFEVVVGDGCSLERLSTLDGYGLIHFYTHSWPWPSNEAIEEIYLMSGEAAPDSVQDDRGEMRRQGTLMTVYVPTQDQHVYFVSPAFVAASNDFQDERSLIYLAAPYSLLGTWQTLLTQTAGASTVVGADWRVHAEKNLEWSTLFYSELLSTWSDHAPFCLGEWFGSESPTYLDTLETIPPAPREVRLGYAGDAELQMRTDFHLLSVWPPVVTTRSDVTLTGWGFGDSQGSSRVHLDTTELEVVSPWADERLVVRAPDDLTSGELTVTVDGRMSNGLAFAVVPSRLDDMRRAEQILVSFAGRHNYEGNVGSGDWHTYSRHRTHNSYNYATNCIGETVAGPIEWTGSALTTELRISCYDGECTDNCTAEISAVLDAHGLMIESFSGEYHSSIDCYSHGSRRSQAFAFVDLPISLAQCSDDRIVFALEGSILEDHVDDFSYRYLNDDYYESTSERYVSTIWAPADSADTPRLTVTFYLE